MPFKVVLDTNVYSSDKYRLGQGFKTLGRLCKGGHAEVLLPFIVRREFETQLDANAADTLSNFEKSSKKLANSPIPADLRGALDELIDTFKARKQDVLQSHLLSFGEWIQEYGVEERALNGEHAIAAMENYFNIGPPFKALKVREDIPDALLYQEVVYLAKDQPLIFICNDTKLVESILGVPNITHFSDLNSFLASEAVQGVIAQGAASDAEDLLLHLKQFAATHNNSLATYVSHRGAEDLAGTHFSSASLPGDDREAYIYMFGSLDDVEFDWDNATYHGEMVYVVPFAGQGDFNITYYVPKWDVEQVEQRGGSYSYHNDYVVEVDEEAALWVRGMLRIKIADDYEPGDDLEDAIEELNIDEVDSPTLVEDAH